MYEPKTILSIIELQRRVVEATLSETIGVVVRIDVNIHPPREREVEWIDAARENGWFGGGNGGTVWQQSVGVMGSSSTTVYGHANAPNVRDVPVAEESD